MDAADTADGPEDFACPVCQTSMETGASGGADVHRCPAGHGVFLRRADLGNLVEAEADWHRHAGQHTQPMPRITADMTAPPTSKPPARAWVETLFG